MKEILNPMEVDNISQLAMNSVIKISEYLGLQTNWLDSAKAFPKQETDSRNGRIFNICNALNATDYLNAIGGKTLYSQAEFKQEGIGLYFVESLASEYAQWGNKFVPNLSIIDVLMFNSIQDSKALIENYKLVD